MNIVFTLLHMCCTVNTYSYIIRYFSVEAQAQYVADSCSWWETYGLKIYKMLYTDEPV